MIDIFYFDGTIKKAKLKDLPKLKNKKLWIDIKDIKQEEVKILTKHFKLHPVTQEDVLLSHGRIKIESFPNYLFSTFYSVKESRSKSKVNLIVIDYILGKNFIISTHKHEFQKYEKLKEDKKRIARYLNQGPDILFHKLLDLQLDEFFPVLERLDDEIEELDEKIAIVHSDPKLLGKILKVKRK